MELLRRALLVGCVLPGLWLLRLTPLDPLLTVVPVDFAAIQKAQAAAVPEEQKTEAERRRAAIPLPVYIEEVLQYNVFSATGPQWERLLQDVDAVAGGAAAPGEILRRRSPETPKPGAARPVFFRPDEEPIRAALDKLAAGGGTTYVSISRPGEDRHYQVERRSWNHRDFRPGSGFTGRPVPPAFLFYPFRLLGLGSILTGIVLFGLLPGGKPPGVPALFEAAAMAAGLAFFAGPLVLVGGSVQALTRAPWLTIPCWILAAAGVHLFARPGLNAPDPSPAETPGAARALFLREGLVFLAMAFGPLAFLISASVVLWNR